MIWATRQSSLTPLIKPGHAGIRPVSEGCTLKHIPLIAMLRTQAGCFKEAVGPEHYAVGRKSAIDTMHKAVNHAIRHTAVAFFLGVRLYERVRDVEERLHPPSAPEICTGARQTDWDQSPKAAGIPQGCPSGPAGVASGVRLWLEEFCELMRGRARVFAYLDDVVVVCPTSVADRVIQ